MRNRLRLVLVGLVALGATTVFIAFTARSSTKASRGALVVATDRARAVATTSSARSRQPLRPSRSETTPAPELPAQAAATADAYVRASYGHTRGAPSTAWITAVAPITTPAWERHLAAGENAATTDQATVRCEIVRTFPSYAPPGHVGATVLARLGAVLVSEYVEMGRRGAGYVVEAAQ